jgi:DNA-binding NarL/FixJ family response regulator
MKILIAGDDVVIRRLLEIALLDWGYEVQLTCDGTTACAALEGNAPPRLAILDSMLTGMDGLENLSQGSVDFSRQGNLHHSSHYTDPEGGRDRRPRRRSGRLRHEAI